MALTRRPLSVTARFDAPIDGPEFLFMKWRRHDYETFTLPAVGETVTLPAVDLPAVLAGPSADDS